MAEIGEILKKLLFKCEAHQRNNFVIDKESGLNLGLSIE